MKFLRSARSVHDEPGHVVAFAGEPEFARRELRLFVSSTFRDLHAERDALARACFPQARQRLAQRGRLLAEIDLRWGLPVEEDEARIVGLCLAEVQRCREGFVGILGARYGHVPAATPPRPPGVAEADWPARASITEYEIRVGALSNPPPRFLHLYLRRDEREDEPEQAALKRFVRERGLPVHDYGSPEELAHLLFTALADHAALEPAEPGISARVRQQAEVCALGALPDPDAETRLDEWLHADHPRLLLTGAAGIGKSTLLARWWLSAGGTEPMRRGWRGWWPGGAAKPLQKAAHFGGAQAGDARLGRLIAEVSAQLDVADDAEDDADLALAARLHRWHRALARACSGGARVLLLIDGVDELAFGPAAALHWLPPPVEGLRLLLSLRQRGDCPEALAGWPRLDLGPWPPARCAQALQARLDRWGKSLPAGTLQTLAAHPALANPAALALLADELRLAHSPEALAERVAAYARDATPRAVADALLRRLETEHGRDAVAQVCGLLWVSRGGLHESELRSCVESGPAWPAWRWSALMQAFRRSVFDRDGRLGLYDDALRDAVQQRHLGGGEAVAAARARLVASFRATVGPGQPPTRRGVEEWPWQLWRAADARALHEDLSLHPALAAGSWRLEPMTCAAYLRLVSESIGAGAIDAMAAAWCRRATAIDLVTLGRCCVEQQEEGAGRLLADAAAARAGDLGAAAMLSLAALYVQIGRPDDAEPCLQAAGRAAGPAAPPMLQAALLNTRGEWLGAQGDHLAAADGFGRAAQVLEAAGDAPSACVSRCNHGLALLQAGRLDVAVSVLRACAEPLQRYGDVDALLTAELGLALAEERQGRLAAALRTLARTEARVRPLAAPRPLLQVLDQRARVLEQQGQRDAADAAQRERQERAALAGLHDDEVDAMLARVAIRLNLGPRGISVARSLWLLARERAFAMPRLTPAVQRRMQELGAAVSAGPHTWPGRPS